MDCKHNTAVNGNSFLTDGRRAAQHRTTEEGHRESMTRPHQRQNKEPHGKKRAIDASRSAPQREHPPAAGVLAAGSNTCDPGVRCDVMSTNP